jgi:hypothetical protein
MGRLCFSTYTTNIKECDAPESNSTTKDNICSFLGFLHSDMVDSSFDIVMLGGNRNGFGSTGREGCCYS